jgi:hypothetical protein
MKTFGPDYIDYWQSACDPKGPIVRFGVRVRDSHFRVGLEMCVVMKHREEPSNTYQNGYQIPVQLGTLPYYVRMIIEDHVLNYPISDLVEILVGKKSVQEGLRKAPTKIEPIRTIASRAARLPHAS